MKSVQIHNSLNLTLHQRGRLRHKTQGSVHWAMYIYVWLVGHAETIFLKFDFLVTATLPLYYLKKKLFLQYPLRNNLWPGWDKT